MEAKYGEEVSHLKISKILGEFLFKHSRNFFKRVLLQLLSARPVPSIHRVAHWHGSDAFRHSPTGDITG